MLFRIHGVIVMQAIEFEAEVHDGVIKLPKEFSQWSEKSVRVILMEAEQSASRIVKQRQPHPDIAGKGRTLGDLVSPVVDESDWECLN